MLTIGFTNHYYTLWSVTSSERYDDNTGATYLRTTYHYRQNLSMDFDAAKTKIEAMTSEYDIDLELRGENGRFYFTERMIKDFDLWRFTFGKLTGADMRVCDNVWQLNRAYNEESNPKRRVIARQRLIELGALVIYPWTETVTRFRKPNEEEYKQRANEMGIPIEEFMSCNPEWEIPYTAEVKHKYCLKKHSEFLIAKAAEDKLQGHWFENGKRIEIKVKKVRQFHFETSFGTTFIQIMITDDNKVVKYKGSTPIHFDGDDFITIKGTVEHGEYKGVNETRLKRIKVTQTNPIP